MRPIIEFCASNIGHGTEPLKKSWNKIRNTMSLNTVV